METDYSTLKRQTLKELLEARGKVASNKSKAVLTAELMEGDRARSATPPAAMEETLYQREMRTRLEFLPQPISDAMLHMVMANVQEYVMAHSPQYTLSRAESTTGSLYNQVKPKIPYHAFKTFCEEKDEIDGYLQDFERLCDLHDLERTVWVPC